VPVVLHVASGSAQPGARRRRSTAAMMFATVHGQRFTTMTLTRLWRARFRIRSGQEFTALISMPAYRQPNWSRVSPERRGSREAAKDRQKKTKKISPSHCQKKKKKKGTTHQKKPSPPQKKKTPPTPKGRKNNKATRTSTLEPSACTAGNARTGGDAGEPSTVQLRKSVLAAGPRVAGQT